MTNFANQRGDKIEGQIECTNDKCFIEYGCIFISVWTKYPKPAQIKCVVFECC